MNAPQKMKPQVEPGPIFDPFPKPQTMPSGWDLSGLGTTSSQPATTEFDAPTNKG
jgi:hypothetical protein